MDPLSTLSADTTKNEMTFSNETLILAKPLRTPKTEDFPGFLWLNSGPTDIKRVRQHLSMKILGLQFWISVLPNCHFGLVIFLGEG